MREKLTKRVVDSAVPPSEGNRFVWDTQLAGFGLKVTSGGSKIYIFQYRMGGRGAPTRRYTIGRHGEPWTAEGARDEAVRLLGEIKSKDRIDPGAAKLREKRAAAIRPAVDETLNEVFARYETAHLSNLRSARQVKSAFKTDALPKLGKRVVREIARADVIKLLDAIELRGATYQRNRTHAHLSKFFHWCINKGLIETNPAAGLSKLSEASRDRVLSEDELKAIWAACDQIPAPFGSAIRLLILTGQRREEVTRMQWPEVDFARWVWTIPRDRAKNNRSHDVALSDTARKILVELRESQKDAPEEWGRAEYVFTTIGTAPISGWSKIKRLLDEKSEIASWRIHDLRRTVATCMAAMGVGQQVVEAVLNHKSGSRNGVAGIYNRYEYADEKKAALEAWARRVIAITSKRPTAKVLEFRRF